MKLKEFLDIVEFKNEVELLNCRRLFYCDIEKYMNKILSCIELQEVTNILNLKSEFAIDDNNVIIEPNIHRLEDILTFKGDLYIHHIDRCINGKYLITYICKEVQTKKCLVVRELSNLNIDVDVTNYFSIFYYEVTKDNQPIELKYDDLFTQPDISLKLVRKYIPIEYKNEFDEFCAENKNISIGRIATEKDLEMFLTIKTYE